MEQKKVELISFELKDFRIIKAVKLDFDKWKDTNVLEVIGDIGNGKSSLLEGLEIATTGASHIKDKSLLDLGFKSEVLLSDGEHKIYMGVKVVEITRGENKGKPKFETYLYEKDLDGKLVSNPIIDGKKATAKEYTDLLSTALTFRMADMFSENQTIHRNLIQELFAKELSELGVEELLDRIMLVKADRDSARHDRDRAGATFEGFKEEGLTEDKLEKLNHIDVTGIEDMIRQLEVDKGILLKSPEEEKVKKLNIIKDAARVLVDKIRDLNDKKNAEYSEKKKSWDELKSDYDLDNAELSKAKTALTPILIPKRVESKISEAFDMWDKEIKADHSSFLSLTEPTSPETIQITDGKPVLGDTIPKGYSQLVDLYKIEQQKYIHLNAAAVSDTVDTVEIDAKIEQKQAEKESADKNNEIVRRYTLLKTWIEARGKYEKEIDTLRKLYTKINTGVDGLVITPTLTESGRLEIWFEYNGQHSPELFKNKDKVYQRFSEYSKSQRAIVGVLLQAARLDKKGKALRIVVLDDYTQTQKGKALLEKICKERDLKLVIARTDDRYDLKKLDIGEMIIENGELLLG